VSDGGIRIDRYQKNSSYSSGAIRQHDAKRLHHLADFFVCINLQRLHAFLANL
jgi:hypothetical protein